MLEVLYKFDIKLQQILSITTDNAVNMIKMVELMNDFDTGRKIGLFKSGL